MNIGRLGTDASDNVPGAMQLLPLPLDFQARDYLLLNQDVAAANLDPSEHWLRYGFFEGRRYATEPGSRLKSNLLLAPNRHEVSEFNLRRLLGTIGIGIITYKRSESLETLLESIFATNIGNCPVVVFEDGSDSTEVVKRFPVMHVRGNSNLGVVVSKNRALGYFWGQGGIDQAILLEDDLEISRGDWLEKWSLAIQKFGHVNFNPHDSTSPPLLADWLTGQVHGIQLNRLTKWLGYLNPNFKGYGYGHVEWTYRHLRCGQGGFFDSAGKASFLNYGYGIENRSAPSNSNEQQLQDNREKIKSLALRPENCSLPWKSESSRLEFSDFTITDFKS